jgi:hypothetical protein
LAASPSDGLDTLTVALSEPVDLGNVLSPTNDSERLLFRNLFDNLIRLDCQGTVRPGLAESWTEDSGKRAWIFTLRDGAKFGSGLPMSAAHVAGTLAPAWAGGRSPGIDSAVALNDRQLRLFLSGTQDSVPHFLADPALAMVDGLATDGRGSGGSIAIPAHGSLPAVDLQFPPGGDVRDALDHGVDLVVTRDPAVIDYVAGRSEFATYPLPWSRTYVLLQPAAAEPLDVVSTEPERRSLARDAVQADARGAEPLFWWHEAAACPNTVAPGSRSTSSRVAYIRGDEVARGLAERVVALARSGIGLRTVALEPAEFIALLRTGSERGYVVALPRQTLAPCRESAALPGAARIQPLIDTRAHAIIRRGAPPITIEWDGTVRVVEP